MISVLPYYEERDHLFLSNIRRIVRRRGSYLEGGGGGAGIFYQVFECQRREPTRESRDVAVQKGFKFGSLN